MKQYARKDTIEHVRRSLQAFATESRAEYRFQMLLHYPFLRGRRVTPSEAPVSGAPFSFKWSAIWLVKLCLLSAFQSMFAVSLRPRVEQQLHR